MDIYQGSIGTVSPAFGNYTLQTYINIDKMGAGVTGIVGPLAGQGVTGTGTLTAVSWDAGVTGIVGSQATNSKHGYFL
jgi:hypothetical protein